MLLLRFIDSKSIIHYGIRSERHVFGQTISATIKAHANDFEVSWGIGSFDNGVVVYFGIDGSAIFACHPCCRYIGGNAVIVKISAKSLCTTRYKKATGQRF